MPELPEVETVANGVNERVRGRRIVSVTLGSKPEPLKSPAELIEETLTGARIERVYRVGKTIVFDLSRALSGAKAPASSRKVNVRAEARTLQSFKTADGRLTTAGGQQTKAASAKSREGSESAGENVASGIGIGGIAQFTVHLGMTGRLLVSQAEVEVPPHTQGIFALDDGREIRFVDPRRFGRMAVVDPETKYAGPGSEPLTISVDDFVALFRGRKTAIKAALLNQSLLHGVGNIYADESLFRAGIRPTKQAGKLTRAELTKLHGALQDVLKHAIQLGGSSVSDYVDADGVRGFFQLEHRVYGRTGELCKVCETPLKKTVVGGRTTHYCPKCQR